MINYDNFETELYLRYLNINYTSAMRVDGGEHTWIPATCRQKFAPAFPVQRNSIRIWRQPGSQK